MNAIARRRGWIMAAVAAAVFATTASAGSPAPFELDFNGSHVHLAASPNGFGHTGDFSATGALCSAGTATDQRVIVGAHVSSIRKYTCNDGSGTFTVHVIDIPFEHVVGGVGTWQVTSGTGSYAKLRGTGSWKTQTAHGDESNLPGLTFTTKTVGTAFIDDTPPQPSFIRVTSKKLAKPTGVYRIVTTLAAPDDSGETTVYRLRIKGGSRTLSSRAGTTAGRVSVSVTVRPALGQRALSLLLTATDAVGNTRTITHRVTLPR
ncbi:MAG TPA: hypothetical protein VGU02_03970 [Gaiellaceae bacterium]|nr:hypothetical protein [Gaiellaceae bacterium]